MPVIRSENERLQERLLEVKEKKRKANNQNGKLISSMAQVAILILTDHIVGVDLNVQEYIKALQKMQITSAGQVSQSESSELAFKNIRLKFAPLADLQRHLVLLYRKQAFLDCLNLRYSTLRSLSRKKKDFESSTCRN